MDIIESDKATARAYFANRGIKLNHPVDAEEVGSFLESIGDVSSEEIVTLATNVDSPIHKYFEWDNVIAGHAYRLSQARNLVLSIHVVDDENNNSMRAFESVIIDNRRVYASMDKISKSKELTEQVIESALRELNYWALKHQTLKKFFGGVFDVIKKTEEAYRRKNEKVSKGKKSRKRRKVVKTHSATNKKTNGKHNDNRGLASTSE